MTSISTIDSDRVQPDGMPTRPEVWIYAGPTIRPSEVRSRCDRFDAELNVLPPIEQGDILRNIHRLPDVIAIIDGYFYQVPAVLHKELLLAIESGCRVIGASSLGALRAVELSVFGMEGCGRIFEWFQSGRIDGDDEVAVTHGPQEIGYRPLTVPLVNVRETIHRGVACGVLSDHEARRILAAARNLHFTARTWDAVLEQIQNQSATQTVSAQAVEWLRCNCVDLKYEDAVELLDLLGERLAGKQPWPELPVLQVNRSRYLHILEREYVGGLVNGHHIPDCQVLSLAKLLEPDFAPRHDVIVRRLAAAEVARGGGRRTAADEVLLDRFESLTPEVQQAGLQSWLRCRSLTRSELLAHLRLIDLVAQGVACDPIPSEQVPSEIGTVALNHGIAESTVADVLFTRQSMPWEQPLIRDMKVTGDFEAARMRAAEIVCGVDRIFAGNEPLRLIMEATADLARSTYERWAAELWQVPASQFMNELQRRGFTCLNEFIASARLAHLHRNHEAD